MRASFPRIRPIAQPQRLTRQELRQRARERTRRAWRQLAILVPLLTATLLAFHYREAWFGTDRPIRIGTAIVMLIIGWGIARGLGRALQARFAERLDPGTGGVLSFVVRLITIGAILLVSLHIAGLKPSTLALGASFTAVVFGLGAQQTIGNIIAGVMLVSARPFSIGDRVRFAGFGMDVEGTVVAHGLLYVTCTDGADLVLVPNNTALTMSIRPIREPAGVDMRARLPREVDPEAVQDRVGEALTVTTRKRPEVHLEEFVGDEVVMRIQATPVVPERGAVLAREVLRTVTAIAEEVESRDRDRDREPAVATA
jgi:small conductance mechanosensitive channel